MATSLVGSPGWCGFGALLVGVISLGAAEAADRAVALAERRAQLQARIAAEPQRVKEILHEHGIDWCGMAAQVRGRNPVRLHAVGGCPIEGDPDLPANRDACIPGPTTPFKVIRLKFNVFRQDDGSAAAATQTQVDDQVEALNASYAASRVRFVYTAAFINSSKFRSLAYFVNSEEAEMKQQYADRPAQQHNIYVTDIEPDPESGGGLLGVSTFPWDSDAVRAGGGTILDDGSIGAGQLTLVHELGHALGLWHTHHGVREVEQCSACWERADGTAPDTTGDFCSDTPPTPVNYKCQGPGGSDPCSAQPWGPTAPQNYMGYAPDDCYTEFTPQQAGRMHCWIQARLQGWLVTEQEVTVELVASDPGASEAGPDAGTFTVTRTGNTTVPLTVNFTRGGSATQGPDYLAIGNSVAIPAGSASANVRVTPVNDTEVEPAETVVLTLAEGAGYQLGGARTGTVTIADDDAPTGPVVTIAATDPAAAEQGADPAVFTVTRTGPTTAALSIAYNVGGTATAADYTPALSGTAVIPAGSGSVALTVTPVNDTALEPSETLILTLANGAGYTVGTPNSATATIADDDGPVNTTLLTENFDRTTPPSLPAGWASEELGVGQPWRTVRLDDVTLVNIAVANSTDGLSEIGLVSPAFDVPASGARLSFLHAFDLEEDFDGGVLELSIAGGAFQDVLAAGGVFESGGYTGTISLEDGSPIAGRSAWTGTSLDNVETAVRLPAAAAGKSVRLRWRLACDPAVAQGGWGLDFIEVTGLGGAAQPLVSVTASDASASETGPDGGTFTIARTGSTAAPLVVNVSAGGTASPGADYAALGPTVTIPAASASVTVAVAPVNDTAPEPLETVILTVQPGNGYAVGTPANATVTLADDDGNAGGVVFAENFDGVTVPSLPSGWSAAHAGAGSPWQSVAFDRLSPPNAVYALNPDTESDNALVSPPIAIATGEARLSFEHGYVLEDGYDGGVLEIALGNGPFADILAAGGRFVSGGYNGSVSTTDGSLIAGRAAWTGDSGVFVTTEVQLPAAAAGQAIRLRWRLVTDGGIGGSGWALDNVAVREAGTGALPSVAITATDAAGAEYGPDDGGFTLSRTGGTAAPLTVRFTTGGSAEPGADYEPLGTSVVIPAGSSTVALRVTVRNDAALEGAEVVHVRLEADPAYALGAQAEAQVTLLDNGTTAPVVFGANFDEVTPPALPPGWSAHLTGTGLPWASVADELLTRPNRLFAPDPDDVSDNLLVSPPIPIATASAQLVFVHEYQLEPGYDGVVLEIALDSGGNATFQDILAAGGTFVAGGYDGPLSLEDRSPIAGRSAWTGASEGPRVTRVNLPAAGAGKSIRLRWRCASDGGVSDLGYALDTVAVTEAVAGGGADLGVAIVGSPSPVVAESRLTYTITVTNHSAVAARGVVLSNALPPAVQLLTSSTSQGTVSGTSNLVAQLGQLNGRASATVSAVVVSSSPGTLNATARVTAAEADPVPGNNSAAVATTVLPTTTPVFRYTNATAVVVSEAAGAAATYPSSLVVSGFQGSVGVLAVTLHGLSHTFPDDLDILLVGPGGQRVMLMSDAGGDERFGLTHTTLTFEDAAATAVPDRAQIVTGTYRPADYEAGENLPGPAPQGPSGAALSVFNGTSPNGTWQLFVADDADKDAGRLAAGWSLAITRAAANATPPTLTSQPQGQVVAAGGTVVLRVTATGTAPLNYQWRFNGLDLPGANQATLTLANVTAAQTGDYTVRVANDAGVVVSRAATVTVTTQARQLRLASPTAAPGSTVSVPVTIEAQGNENRARFSVGFDIERLRFTSVTLGNGAGGAALNVNVNQLESGRLGLQVALPAGQALAAGQRQLAVLEFDALPGGDGSTPLAFLDAPSAREVAGAAGQPLAADYLPGTVTLTSAAGPTIGGLTITATGTVQFTVTGKAGASVRIEASADLDGWDAVTVLANPTGTVVFSEARTPGVGAKFYRAVQLP